MPAGSAAHGLLGEIDSEVKASLGDIRRLVEALRPPALDELGLLGAVRSRAAALAGDLTIEVVGNEPTIPLPAAVETAAYRIVVEAVTNAVRHSGGTRCTVSISVSGMPSTCWCATTVEDWTRTERPEWGCAPCRSGPMRWAAPCRYGRPQTERWSWRGCPWRWEV